MAKAIWSAPPQNPEDALCSWGSCNRPVDPDVPICGKHLLRAWGIVNGTLQSLGEMPRPPLPKAQGYVYFVRFRDRVKIGYTTNMISRMVAIPHDEILAVHPGTMQDERRCHEAFAHLRENGEWFRIEPDLLAFIEDVASRVA